MIGRSLESLTPAQKAAIILTSLPPEAASELLGQLENDQRITLKEEVANLFAITPSLRETVIQEFIASSQPSPHFPVRPPFPEPSRSAGPFSFLNGVDERVVSALLQPEHPQTAAMVLAHLRPQRSSLVLGCLSSDLQPEVAARLASLGFVPTKITEEVARLLKSRLEAIIEGRDDGPREGRKILADILNAATRETEDTVMRGLRDSTPDLARRLKRTMCDFEDCKALAPPSLALLVQLVDDRDLALVLKADDGELASKVYQVCSATLRESLKADVRRLSCNDWQEVRQARHRIRNILRGLVGLGKVQLAPTG